MSVSERRLDTLMMADYRGHVEKSLTGEPCDCSLTTPDRNCDLGYALFSLAIRGDWDDRKIALLARGANGRTMSPASRLATLQADLERAETRLKLAVHRANWGDAVFFAGEAARLDTELKAARADVTPGDEKKVASFV